MPLTRKTPRLTLAEACSAAQSFLVHIEAPPSKVDEPADGIVEMVGSDYFARVRYDDAPVTQRAVLALLRHADDLDASPILFSVSGFTSSAVALGENITVALFEVSPIGDIASRTQAAHSLMPEERFEPPYKPEGYDEHEGDRPPGKWLPGQDGGIADHEWLDCPSCGTTHHPEANFCHKCGAGLARKNRIVPTAAPESDDEATRRLPIEARRRAKARERDGAGPRDTSSYRCRVCGSRDIAVGAD